MTPRTKPSTSVFEDFAAEAEALKAFAELSYTEGLITYLQYTEMLETAERKQMFADLRFLNW